MSPSSWLLCIACTVVVLSSAVNALNCYQCESTNHADCKEQFDHDHLDTITIRSEECRVDAAQYCVKTTGVWGGVVGTTRFCSSRDMGNECKFVTYPDHDRVYRACIYTCSGSHCNGSQRLVQSGFGLLTIMCTALFSFLCKAL
ncbi:hypothetical protein CAPTEDRAFT_166625 [Capitella teleta]|uniref:Protein sleepless n=1 Tax=Capitella teleta TaxID=283909 RepID=R7VAA0_CAPTE|nr:hypothetical protein CAPTEDRAFT_166625 [Capitella teleta]|eukprot:ELU12640.1 hypothetical protein CAPTEDRAFT_166625 [Capitella teleta]